jgi:hypothetical protein
MIDRRSVFFAIAAVVCAALVPLSEPDLRWVPEAVAVTYVVFAILSALDAWSRARPDESEPTEQPPPAT